MRSGGGYVDVNCSNCKKGISVSIKKWRLTELTGKWRGGGTKHMTPRYRTIPHFTVQQQADDARAPASISHRVQERRVACGADRASKLRAAALAGKGRGWGRWQGRVGDRGHTAGWCTHGRSNVGRAQQRW